MEKARGGGAKFSHFLDQNSKKVGFFTKIFNSFSRGGVLRGCRPQFQNVTVG